MRVNFAQVDLEYGLCGSCVSGSGVDVGVSEAFWNGAKKDAYNFIALSEGFVYVCGGIEVCTYVEDAYVYPILSAVVSGNVGYGYD